MCQDGSDTDTHPRDSFVHSKRAGYLEAWDTLLRTASVRGDWRLADLFAPAEESHPERSEQFSESSTRVKTSSLWGGGCTLRLEHRRGGLLAPHGREERILLFRSDRPGAIGKIIYTFGSRNSVLEGETTVPRAAECSCTKSPSSSSSRPLRGKVHVLNVHESYRGLDLGGLLLREALLCMQDHFSWCARPDPTVDPTDSANRPLDELRHHSAPFLYCELEAEEDVRRHNRLLRFYQRHGWKVKDHAKWQYLNNNDGETYRKIPMEMLLPIPRPAPHRPASLLAYPHTTSFLPILLEQSCGKPIHVSLDREVKERAHLLILQVDTATAMGVEFQTTTGLRLGLDGDGQGHWLNHHSPDEYTQFELFRVDSAKLGVDMISSEVMCMMRSRAHGTFLSVDAKNGTLIGAPTPVFWLVQPDAGTLVWIPDGPAQREHYRRQWKTQTVGYAQSQAKKYSLLSLSTMPLRQALDAVHSLTAHFFPSQGQHTLSRVSVRTRCFRTAEYFRQTGQPDWVQFVALVYHLGALIKCIDPVAAMETSHVYDWTLASRSRVLGCRSPDGAAYSEFRALGPDEHDSRYQSLLGMYDLHGGLDQVVLTWSGPQYIALVLQGNQVDLPPEAFKMLRLASLVDWHTHHHAYAHLTDVTDQDVQVFVADFDQQLTEARQTSDPTTGDLTTEECHYLWQAYYEPIATKYNAGGLLHW